MGLLQEGREGAACEGWVRREAEGAGVEGERTESSARLTALPSVVDGPLWLTVTIDRWGQ